MTTEAPHGERKRAPRRDAQRRRAALIAAATECFASEGFRVPLDTIAERAGVGRGTLYRNFKDRDALAVAIFAGEVDRLERIVDPSMPIEAVLADMIRDGAAAASLFARIAADLQLDESGRAAYEHIRERLERLLEPVVIQARSRGEIDRAVTAADIVLAVRMTSALVYPFMAPAEIAVQVGEALRLLFTGLRPR